MIGIVFYFFRKDRVEIVPPIKINLPHRGCCIANHVEFWICDARWTTFRYWHSEPVQTSIEKQTVYILGVETLRLINIVVCMDAHRTNSLITAGIVTGFFTMLVSSRWTWSKMPPSGSNFIFEFFRQHLTTGSIVQTTPSCVQRGVSTIENHSTIQKYQIRYQSLATELLIAQTNLPPRPTRLRAKPIQRDWGDASEVKQKRNRLSAKPPSSGP